MMAESTTTLWPHNGGEKIVSETIHYTYSPGSTVCLGTCIRSYRDNNVGPDVIGYDP